MWLFWKRKDSWSQASLQIQHAFCRRPVSAMFPNVVLRLPRPWVNRLLPSLTCHVTLSHGEVIIATDAWSILHDSSPRRKETQSAWDDLACWDSLAVLLNTPSPWKLEPLSWLSATILTAQKSHTVAWSEAFPIASVGNWFPVKRQSFINKIAELGYGGLMT